MMPCELLTLFQFTLLVLTHSLQLSDILHSNRQSYVNKNNSLSFVFEFTCFKLSILLER